MGAGYFGTLNSLLNDPPERILGVLTEAAAHAGYVRHWHSQTRAWRHQLDILKATAQELMSTRDAAKCWTCLLEYEVPRRQRRIDAVVLADKAVVILEFKV